MLVYAASTDLDNPPANAVSLLEAASLLVRLATRAAVYDAAPSGLPTDSDTAQAMRDATCAQVKAWIAAGIDPSGQGLSPTVVSRSMGGRSVQYSTPDPHYDRLCAAALGYLGAAGLLSGQPGVSYG